VGILVGFAPWIVYWVLVGNVPFTLAALVALAIAVAALVSGRATGKPTRTLEIGSVATFLVLTVLTVLTYALSSSFVERWILPLSNAGIFLVTLVGVLIGKPFVREFAQAELSTEVIKSEAFGPITALVTWIWVATFGGMTVSSSIPPIVAADATILDTRSALSFACYWVISFALLGGAVIASRILLDRMVAEATSPHTVRRTTFLAFRELEIDQLYYLAQQKAEREVGAGMEPYDVKIGSQGVPLTGDESRESWPATYKVRERR
jgi:hypothetical protein